MLILLCALTACNPADPVTELEEEEQAIPVEVTIAEKGQLAEGLRITGDVIAHKQVLVSPKLAGKVTRIYVEKGEVVEEGDRLAELEQTDFIHNVRQAEAMVQSAKANLEHAQGKQRDQHNSSQRTSDQQFTGFGTCPN